MQTFIVFDAIMKMNTWKKVSTPDQVVNWVGSNYTKNAHNTICPKNVDIFLARAINILINAREKSNNFSLELHTKIRSWKVQIVVVAKCQVTDLSIEINLARSFFLLIIDTPYSTNQRIEI